MASIRREITIAADRAAVWDAVRAVGALHVRLVPGFAVDTRLDGDARIVTFGNGAVARERIVEVDDVGRRLVWSIVGGRFTHHNGAVQVLEEPGGGARVVWIADLLPHALAPEIAGLMEQGLTVMKRTLEAAAGRAPAAPLRSPG
jgi:carbon monoxide dehydrogenase subunit G